MVFAASVLQEEAWLLWEDSVHHLCCAIITSNLYTLCSFCTEMMLHLCIYLWNKILHKYIGGVCELLLLQGHQWSVTWKIMENHAFQHIKEQHKMTLSNTFSSQKMYAFWFKFHWFVPKGPVDDTSKSQHTVECPYNAGQHKMILHTSLQWLRQKRKSKDYVYGIWLHKVLGIWNGYYRVKKNH